MHQQHSRRNTRQRKIILQAVRQLGCHPTAEQIFDAVRKELPRTSLSTVYRNLGVLVDQGEVTAIRGFCRQKHYDFNVEEHYHIECSVCGRVEDTVLKPLDIIKSSSEAVLGFIVNEIQLNILGICPECAEKMKKEETR